MKKKRLVTAEELVSQLNADSEWVARRQASDRELAERAAVHTADELSLVNELRGCGCAVVSVWI